MGGGAGGCCPEEHRPTSLHLQQVGRDSPKHVARLGPGCLGSSAWVGSFSPRTSWGTQLGTHCLGLQAPLGRGLQPGRAQPAGLQQVGLPAEAG